MTTKEKYLEEALEEFFGCDPAYCLKQEVEEVKRALEIGYKYLQPKWISVDEQLPDNDRTVLVWIKDTKKPQWSNYGLCSYIHENWYCSAGRDSHEIVTDWSEIPAKK